MKWVCTSTIPGIPSSCQICLTGAGSKADSDIRLSISTPIYIHRSERSIRRFRIYPRGVLVRVRTLLLRWDR